MALPTLPEVDPYKKIIQAPGYRRWRELVEATGGCTHPVRLSGHWKLIDTATGTSLACSPRTRG